MCIRDSFLGEPGSCCTETYLVIGPFNAKEEAENVISYIKTKFFLSLIHISFVDMGRELADMGADAIVIKDMAGLIPPYVTQEPVSYTHLDVYKRQCKST